MSPRVRLVLPSALGVVALAQGCTGPSDGLDGGLVMCPPADANVQSIGRSLNGNPSVEWNGMPYELLPDGGCERPPTV